MAQVENKPIRIYLVGCDDRTVIETLASPLEQSMLRSIARRSIDLSKLSCQPRMKIQDGEEPVIAFGCEFDAEPEYEEDEEE